MVLFSKLLSGDHIIILNIAYSNVCLRSASFTHSYKHLNGRREINWNQQNEIETYSMIIISNNRLFVYKLHVSEQFRELFQVQVNKYKKPVTQVLV